MSFYALLRNKRSERIILNTTQIRILTIPFVECYGERGEMVQHIINECEKLAQKEYKRRHDNTT